MTKDKFRPVIFIASDEDKKIATETCNKIIDMLSEYPLDLKAFILQNLIESFEESAEIDLRHGISIKDKA